MPLPQKANTPLLSDSPKANALQLPAELSVQNSEGQAFTALFRKWGISTQGRENLPPCEQGISCGLQCLYGRDNLDSLIKLNRPVVLRLFDDQKRQFYVALTGIQDDKATVETGNDARIVNVKDIERRWLGDYILIWNPPPGYRGDIHPGMQGIDVAWIDFQLAAIQGRKAKKRKCLPIMADLYHK